MFGRIIQRLLKLFFSRKFDFKITDANLPESPSIKTLVDTGPYIPKRLNNGVANATYSNRFVILPINFFTAIYLNKDISQVDDTDVVLLCSKNFLNSKRSNIEEFIKEFDEWRNHFFTSFELQSNVQNEALQVLREEIFHNKHLKGTTTWNFSQALTVFYRLNTTYLTYYRNKKGCKLTKNKIQIVKSLLNSYFIRQFISKNTTILVEAFYHYKDNNLNDIKILYGLPTYNFCLRIIKLDEYFEENFPDKKDELLTFISKIILNYPFALQVAKYTNLEYNKFKEYYYANPINRFIVIEKLILHNKFSSVLELKSKIEQAFSKSSRLEYDFASSITYYATEGIVPKKLISFLIRRVISTKYRIVVWEILKDLIKGGKEFNKAYSDYPAIWSFGINNEVFNIDPATKLFNGKAFFIAQNSLEPTLLGEDGSKNILNSKKCTSLLIQTVFLKAIFFTCEIPNSKEKLFIEDFDISFRARPYINSHRGLIESEILPYFYEMAQKYKAMYENNRDGNSIIFDNDFAINFENDISVLVNYVNRLEEFDRNKFLSLCDLNYAHGY